MYDWFVYMFMYVFMYVSIHPHTVGDIASSDVSVAFDMYDWFVYMFMYVVRLLYYLNLYFN